MIHSFLFPSRRRHTRCLSDWSSDVCSSDLPRKYLRHDSDAQQGSRIAQADGGRRLRGRRYFLGRDASLHAETIEGIRRDGPAHGTFEMKKYKIAVIAGDGIGKEVVPEGLRVLEAAG